MMEWAYTPGDTWGRGLAMWESSPYEIVCTPKGYYHNEPEDTYTANCMTSTGRRHIGVYDGLAQAQDACEQDLINTCTNRLTGRAL